MRIGYHFLLVLAVFFPFLYILYVTRSCIQGMGNSLLPMISSIVQLVMRNGCALLLPALIGESGVFYGEVCAWLGADLLLAFSYFHQYEEAQDSGRTSGDLILSEFRPVIWVVISSAFFYNKKAPHSAQVISAGTCRPILQLLLGSQCSLQGTLSLG